MFCRYELLTSFFHLADNSLRVDKGEPGYDPLFKVRPLLDIVDPTYASVFCPGQKLSVDESMVKFKGRVSFRQYMPAKPVRFGMKQFVVCDSKTGYALKYLTYTGKNTFPRDPGLGLGEQVVLSLLEDYTDKGHIVFTDNFYSSPSLFSMLKDKGIGACGTVRANRKHMPAALNPSNLHLTRDQGPVFMKNSDDLVACAWQDVKRVHFLSTVHTDNTVEKQIRSKDSTDGYRTVEKPVMGDDYNSNMGGVDLLDQKLGTYAFPHKSQKWYMPLYHRVREVALVNGYIVYSESQDRPVPPRKFREAVISGLLGEYYPSHIPTRKGRPHEGPVSKRLTERHFIEHLSSRPDCTVCSNRSVPQGRVQTRYRCKQCKQPLCVEPCFELYHQYTDYKAAWASLQSESE